MSHKKLEHWLKAMLIILAVCGVIFFASPPFKSRDDKSITNLTAPYTAKIQTIVIITAFAIALPPFLHIMPERK